MSTFVDLTGQRFGRLIALQSAGKDNGGNQMWKCRCDCGKETITRARSLWTGNTRSCGCLQKEKASKVWKTTHTTHGESGTRLNKIHRALKQRCNNQKNPAYKDYGGRGITVCEEWAQSFEAFRDWALANGYRDDLTIDRIDNDGPYSQENCRWISMKQQCNNRRSNRIITYNGESHTVTEWAELTGINYHTLMGRLYGRGWNAEKALTTKARRINNGRNTKKTG